VLARRARLYEALAPFRRAARRFDASMVVQQSVAEADHLLRLGWHLSLHPYVDEQHLHAVDLLLSYDAWDRLRQAQHLSVEEATTTLHAALKRLLG